VRREADPIRSFAVLVAVLGMALLPPLAGAVVVPQNTPAGFVGVAYAGSDAGAADLDRFYVCGIGWSWVRYTLTLEASAPSDALRLHILEDYSEVDKNQGPQPREATARPGQPAVIEAFVADCTHDDFRVEGVSVVGAAAYRVTLENIPPP